MTRRHVRAGVYGGGEREGREVEVISHAEGWHESEDRNIESEKGERETVRDPHNITERKKRRDW